VACHSCVLFVAPWSYSQRLRAFACVLPLPVRPSYRTTQFSLLLLASLHTLQVDGACSVLHLMAKQGRLVDVPRDMTSDIITVKQLADYLEPILTAAAGGSLDAYRL